MIEADHSLGLDLDVQVDFSEAVVDPGDVFTGVSHCGGNEHEPASQPQGSREVAGNVGADGGDDTVRIGHKAIKGPNGGGGECSLGRTEAGESEDEGYGEEGEGRQVGSKGQEGEGQGDDEEFE